MPRKAKLVLLAFCLLCSHITVAGLVLYYSDSGNQPATSAQKRNTKNDSSASVIRLYEVNFDKADWSQVVLWLVKETNLEFVGDDVPVGQVTLKSRKKLSIGELFDKLNERMMIDNHILVRKNSTFAIHPADERIPLKFVPVVSPLELSKRGKTEQVALILPLRIMDGESAGNVVRKRLSQFGDVKAYNQDSLLVQDQAAKVRAIMSSIK